MGLSRQRGNQALSRFKALAVVRTEYGGITILDLDRLTALTAIE